MTGFRYPDFYNDEYVLDAKYKSMADSVEKIEREDLHQMITYLHILKPTPKNRSLSLSYKGKYCNLMFKEQDFKW